MDERRARIFARGNLLAALKPMGGARRFSSFPWRLRFKGEGQAICVVDGRRHRIGELSKADFK